MTNQYPVPTDLIKVAHPDTIKRRLMNSDGVIRDRATSARQPLPVEVRRDKTERRCGYIFRLIHHHHPVGLYERARPPRDLFSAEV